MTSLRDLTESLPFSDRNRPQSDRFWTGMSHSRQTSRGVPGGLGEAETRSQTGFRGVAPNQVPHFSVIPPRVSGNRGGHPGVSGAFRGRAAGKGTSGGLRRYTRSTVFEKACGTREFSLRGWEVRWSVASSQTNQPSWQSLAKGYEQESGSQETAWYRSVMGRKGHAGEENYKNAEHYLYAKSLTSSNFAWFPVEMVAVPLYSGYKALIGSPMGWSSSASWSEIGAGWSGALDGAPMSGMGKVLSQPPIEVAPGIRF